jgi:hypothetical protein
MDFSFENICTRKVLVEKYLDLGKKGYFGMKFCSYKSNKESLLVVNFRPEIVTRYITNNFGETIERLESVDLIIVDSIDNNGSSEFVKWYNEFEKNKRNKKGVDIFFFVLNNDRYQPILSLRGCFLDVGFISEGRPVISVNFFAYSFHRENC